MLNYSIATFFLSIQIIGSHVVPFTHHWARFKSSEGKYVFVNLNAINDPDNVSEEIDINKVEFHLYTKRNPTVSQRLYINNTKSLNSSNYDINVPTKFIVHGFLNNLNSDTIQSIKDNFLDRDLKGYNVIAVDWSYYTKVYTNVLDKSKGVGQIIGEFVDFLVNYGSKLKHIHLIGHSLGAHACGFAGKTLKSGKLARISGLDPALPGFDVSNREERLDSLDARFVDCIHTCAGFLGIEDPICTSDYYPNSGKDQPGCPWIDFGTCSHGRSHEYYAESIIKGHNFPSQTCLSLNFGQEECISQGALMGYPATEDFTGILFTQTNSVSPYSMNITSMK